MLNRVAEKVRELFPNVNKLINNVKKSFLKSTSHIQLYKENLVCHCHLNHSLRNEAHGLMAVILNANTYEGIENA